MCSGAAGLHHVTPASGICMFIVFTILRRVLDNLGARGRMLYSFVRVCLYSMAIWGLVCFS